MMKTVGMLARQMQRAKWVCRRGVRRSSHKDGKLARMWGGEKTHRAVNASHFRPGQASREALNVNVVLEGR